MVHWPPEAARGLYLHLHLQVTDIADAALLTTLFTLLFERGVVVVATSNKTPDTLYDMSAGFAAFVGLLKRRCVIHRLDRRQDYRLLGTVTHNTYFTPHNADTERRVYATFVRLTDHPVTKGAVLPHFGRTLVVPYAKGPCALFSFQYLCGDGTALGPNDYGALARAFHTICITDIPVLGLRNRQQSRRFISLVDELYRYKVKVCFYPFSLFFFSIVFQFFCCLRPTRRVRSDNRFRFVPSRVRAPHSTSRVHMRWIRRGGRGCKWSGVDRHFDPAAPAPRPSLHCRWCAPPPAAPTVCLPLKS